MCNKSFIDSRLLYSHSKVHSSLKPYECSYCDKRFTHQSTLTSHVRTHTGEKPYVCSVCGKSFIQSSNLSLHMRVHSGNYYNSNLLTVKTIGSVRNSKGAQIHIRLLQSDGRFWYIFGLSPPTPPPSPSLAVFYPIVFIQLINICLIMSMSSFESKIN